MKYDTRQLMNQLAEQERRLRGRELLAPYSRELKCICIQVDGLRYLLRTRNLFGSGFGVFITQDGVSAEFLREADDIDVRSFLNVLPKLHFILSYETDEGWIGYPSNQAVARQVFGLDSEVLIRRVRDCQRFDTIVARFDGAHFWYDNVFLYTDPAKIEAMRNCLCGDAEPSYMNECLKQVSGITPEDRICFDLAVSAWLRFRRATTEDQLKQVLARGGGKLGSYIVRGNRIEVKWTSRRGNHYHSLVEKGNLQVVSAGICLSGGDREFNLKDLPFVIDEGERDRHIVMQHLDDDD